MKLSLSTDGRIEGYDCIQCSSYNDILNVYCHYCSAYRDAGISYREFEWNTAVRRGVHLDYEQRNTHSTMTNEDRVELYKSFYDSAALKVSTMTLDQLIARGDELEKIIIEAKADAQATTAERRKREANLSRSEREKLITKPDITGTEALNGPKVRKDRMSKADKLRETYVSLGMSEAEINAIMKNISVDEKKQKAPEVVKRLGSTDSTERYTFAKDEQKGDVTRDVEPKDVEQSIDKTISEAQSEGDIPKPKMDFSKLSFLKK